MDIRCYGGAMTNDDTQWVSRKEAAEMAGVTMRTVDRWADAGRIVRHEDGRGHIRFRLDEVQNMIRIEPVPVQDETEGAHA